MVRVLLGIVLTAGVGMGVALRGLWRATTATPYVDQSTDALWSVGKERESKLLQPLSEPPPPQLSLSSSPTPPSSSSSEQKTDVDLRGDSTTETGPAMHVEQLQSAMMTSGNPMVELLRNTSWRRPPCQAETPSHIRAWFDELPGDMAMCVMVRNERHIIEEWIAFHALQGVRRFIVFDDFSTDDVRSVLQKYEHMGILNYTDVRPYGTTHTPKQLKSLNRCVQGVKRGDYGKGIRWVTTHDVDEFLFPMVGGGGGGGERGTVSGVLNERHADDACVKVSRTLFGSAYWHSRPKEGLAIENYILRGQLAGQMPKLIVNVREGVDRVQNLSSMHRVGDPWDLPCTKLEPEEMRMNHYLRSLEDYALKAVTHVKEGRRYANDDVLRIFFQRDQNGEVDTTAGDKYACDVKAWIAEAYRRDRLRQQPGGDSVPADDSSYVQP